MITIKKEFLQTVIGFGKSGLPLGNRDDIDDLAIIALQSGDPSLLNLFESLPDLAELKKAKTDRELKAVLALKPEPQKTDKEIIADAVPEPFNQGTKVEELNTKPPSTSTK